MTSPAIQYRRATLADVPAIVALVESAYRGDASRAGWTTEADLLDGQRTDADKVAELIRDPSSRILLAEQSGAIVASLLLSVRDNDVRLGMFAVQPALQGAGIGRLVLKEAERVCREELKAVRVDMTVIAQRPELIAWYERRGYLKTGEREAFPYGDVRFGVPKRDDLYFVVLRKTLL
jgi:ribosomal protein S18 acetylase RimI-like enzyme